jgi:hypothetical protein
MAELGLASALTPDAALRTYESAHARAERIDRPELRSQVLRNWGLALRDAGQAAPAEHSWSPQSVAPLSATPRSTNTRGRFRRRRVRHRNRPRRELNTNRSYARPRPDHSEYRARAARPGLADERARTAPERPLFPAVQFYFCAEGSRGSRASSL